jgi:hypothetical protein
MTDTQYTARPVCPHCGYEEMDPLGIYFGASETTEHQCSDCCEPYILTENVSRTYTTRKLTEKQ